MTKIHPSRPVVIGSWVRDSRSNPTVGVRGMIRKGKGWSEGQRWGEG